ncbi:MAG TPA: Ig-like domain repeat protein [Candidatus Angelobacter sp.]|nr:Ig-like domain repeat protein [Candidatus Angelobacter sp.]
MPKTGFSQQAAVASSQDASAIQTPGTQGETNASASSPMIAVKPAFRPPIHIVPFREPGAVNTRLNLFPAGSHVTYFGGPVISNVHIVMVLYGAGSYLPNIAGTATPTMANFFTDITQSTLFDMLSEYSTAGVTAASGTAGTNQIIGHGFFDAPQITIAPAPANNGATITDNQIQAELLSQVTAGHLPAPVIDAQGNNNTLYMIFFPPGKTINDGTINSCVSGGFCAYHNSTNTAFGTHRLFYGVMPDLQPPSGCSTGCGAGSTFDQATNVTSHELSEAVTDADVGPATAFAPPLAWVDQSDQFEIGDICVAQEASVVANGTTYTVQQEFSNLQNNCVAAPPKFQITGGPNVNGGLSFDLDLRIADSNSGVTVPYTGTVHFTSSDNAAVLPADYTFTLADAGFHHFVTTLNTSGAQTITVTDTKLPGFTGTSTLQVNVPNVAQLQFAAPGTATTGVPITFSITALDASSIPVTNYNGTIHFTSTDAAAVLPANSPMVNGLGSFTATFNTAGFQTLQATDVTRASVTGSIQVTATAPSAHPTTTTLTGGPTSPIVFGQQATYLMTVTGNAGNVSGTMNATLDGSVLVSGGIFNSTSVGVNAPGGTHTIYANYLGDGTNAPSSSAPVTLVVNPAPSTMTVNSSQATAHQGTNVTFTVSPSPFVLSRGSVTFFDGTTPLGIISIGQAFSPGFTVTALSVGTHSITASFSGSPDLLPSVSAPIQQVITPPLIPDYSVIPDKASATILAGQAATFNITTTSVNGFAGSVNFSCGTLPALTTCTFNPAIVSVSASSPTLNVVLTVKTTGPHAALFAPRSRHSVHAMLWSLSPFTLGIIFIIGRKRNLRRTEMLRGLLVLALVAGLASCGGGGGTALPPVTIPTTTPAGTTSFTVTAKGTATASASPANPTQQLNISITVQP